MRIFIDTSPKHVKLLNNDKAYMVNQLRDISKVSPELATQIVKSLPEFISAYNWDELTLQLNPTSTELSSIYIIRGLTYDYFYDGLLQLCGVDLNDRYNVVNSIINALLLHKLITF